MYIEFKIQPHEYVYQHAQVQSAIVYWANKNNIAYKTKSIKRNIRLTFEDDAHYTLFLLTWNPNFRANYRIVTDLNNKI